MPTEAFRPKGVIVMSILNSLATHIASGWWMWLILAIMPLFFIKKRRPGDIIHDPEMGRIIVSREKLYLTDTARTALITFAGTFVVAMILKSLGY